MPNRTELLQCLMGLNDRWSGPLIAQGLMPIRNRERVNQLLQQWQDERHLEHSEETKS